ncbi:MAG: dihydropteroate synthase [Marinilabiliaceae bacterium]|nr:dihydropteroate synthase [Marinilabiliaceae bacterium]
MGIMNITPDSFYSQSRYNHNDQIKIRANEILQQGGTIIDVGAYSSRPGADNLSPQEEIARLDKALSIIKKEHHDAIISIDTFRSEVAKFAVDNFEVSLINDISGGTMDKYMFETVARLNVGYILMHMQGTPQTMQNKPIYQNIAIDITTFFSKQIDQLTYLGITDIIIDPGFGFGKTIEHNFQLLSKLNHFKLLNRPILVGLSRKSMIYNTLKINPDDALNGTTVLNTIAIQKGANILRVHDVKEATECIKLVGKMENS